MKNILKTGLFLFTATILFSCTDNENYTNKSNLNVSNSSVARLTSSTPSLSFTAVNTSNESAEMNYVLTATLSTPQSVAVRLAIIQVLGTAVANVDYTADNYIVIPANSLSGTTTVKIKNDIDIETDEDFVLEIGKNAANVIFTPITVKFKIQNYLSNNLDLKFNFNKSFSIGANSLTLCGIGYDMDFYLLDSSFNDTGIYDAAASGCPELLTFTPTLVPDGTYHIFYDIYATGGLQNAYHDPFTIPITVNYIREGGITSGTFAQESRYAPTSTKAPGYQNPIGNYVVTIKKLAGVYTLSNSLNETIVSGRQQNIMTLVHNAIQHARSIAKR